MIFAEKTALEKEAENKKNTVEELTKLMDAGKAFEKLVDSAIAEISAPYKRVAYWYPYKLSSDAAPDHEAEQAFEDYKAAKDIPTAELDKAAKAAAKAKTDWNNYIKDPKVAAFMADKFWKTDFERAILAGG